MLNTKIEYCEYVGMNMMTWVESGLAEPFPYQSQGAEEELELFLKEHNEEFGDAVSFYEFVEKILALVASATMDILLVPVFKRADKFVAKVCTDLKSAEQFFVK